MLQVTALVLLLAAQDQRAPVPDPAAQKEVDKLLREVFKDDYAKKTPGDRLLFAKKLLKQGSDTKDDATVRYFTLHEAMEVAIAAGDAATAMQAIDAMAKSYEVDAVKLKFAALTSVAKDPRPPEAAKAAAIALLALVDEAGLHDDMDTAEKAAVAAVLQARRAKDVALATRAETRSKDLADLRQKLVRIKAARDLLKANPADPAANSEVGQYVCFVQGNWEAGLPLLAKGGDPLKGIATKDLANPETHPEQIALADEWRDAAEKEGGAVRQRIRERAAFWYSKAYGAATGLAKVKVERRLAELGSVAPRIAPIAKDGAPVEGLIGWWKLDEGSGDVVEDSSGNQRSGRSTGAWSEGRIGKGIQTTGKGEMVSIPDAPDLRLTGDMTLALWYRKDAGSPDWVRLAGKGSQTLRNYGIWVGGTNGGDNSRLLFQQWGASGQILGVYSSTRPADGTWTHVAGVLKGSDAAIFVNGRREGAGVRTGSPETSADPLTFSYSGWHACLVGVIDDVRLYNRALSDAEVERLASPK